MSLLINGMDMPKNCSWCFCHCKVDYGRYDCAAIKDIAEIEDTSKRLSCCPLTEIPTPHGRLIDADAYQYSGDLIDEPTIIEAEQGDG